jgi:hypothetical protein
VLLCVVYIVREQRDPREINSWRNYTVEIIPPQRATALNRFINRYREYLPPKLCDLLGNDDSPWEHGVNLTCDGEVLWKAKSFYFAIAQLGRDEVEASALAFGVDLFGTGKPNLIIREDSGGNRCCTTFHIFELAPVLTEIATVDTEYGWFADDDANGIYELHNVSRYEGFFSGAATPGATSIRRWDGNDFVPAPHLMVKPLSGFTNYADVLTDLQRQEELFDDVYAPVFQTVLDLLFSGNTSAGWELLDRARNHANAPSREMVEAFLVYLEADADWRAMESWVKR